MVCVLAPKKKTKRDFTWVGMFHTRAQLAYHMIDVLCGSETKMGLGRFTCCKALAWVWAAHRVG